MQVIYRISNKGHNKPKVPGATKEICLSNTLSAFPKAEFIIIADNCDAATLELCYKTGKQVIKTHEGNSGSFQVALSLLPEDDVVYMAEDDYLYHDQGLEAVIEEGLRIADYVTLYNHPDKYESMYDYGEVAKIRRTPHAYWKETISTTMTFAARSGTLREDTHIWKNFTMATVPCDHEAFLALGKTLVCPIPGFACHMDLSDSEEEYFPEWIVPILGKQFEDFPEFSYQETPIRKLKIAQALLNIRQQQITSKQP